MGSLLKVTVRDAYGRFVQGATVDVDLPLMGGTFLWGETLMGTSGVTDKRGEVNFIVGNNRDYGLTIKKKGFRTFSKGIRTSTKTEIEVNMGNLTFFGSQNKSGGSTPPPPPPPPPDPIQVLVDEYKAYVATQGGEHGVSDAALYAEYEDMVAKGEIQNDGTNTKLVLNGGLWGYKMGEGTKIDYIYSLTKIGGNFFVWDCTLVTVNLIGGKIDFTTLPFFDLDYGLNSFYMEIKSLNHQYGTARSDVFRDLATTNIRLSDATNNRLRCIYPTPDNYSGNNFFANEAADYKFLYSRSNVGGTEKLDLVCQRNGSTVHTFAQRDWDFNMNSGTFTISFHSSSTRDLNSFKFALQ
jgi:hypothetical protein